MSRSFLVVMGIVLAFFVTLAVSGPARACGGGLVSTTEVGGSVEHAQRIVVAINGGVTDVVTQIEVPSTTADYGVLVPVPSEPTLDSMPVDAWDLDQLDSQTTPQVFTETPSSGGGCGCMGADEGKAAGEPLRGVSAGAPVEIGPVTAVVLTADDGAATRAWLAENGFVIPAASAGLIDEFAGPGRYFIAIRRSETAATGAPTSIGVHFSMPGEHAELPLRFAALGAARSVTFTVFVGATEIVVPAAPIETYTLDDLDESILRSAGYATAVAEASTRSGEPGFVIEGAYLPSDLYFIGATLTRMLSSTSHVTRLTTILPKSALTGDVQFTQTYPTQPPRMRTLTSVAATGASAAGMWLLLFFRRPRRVGRPPLSRL